MLTSLATRFERVRTRTSASQIAYLPIRTYEEAFCCCRNLSSIQKVKGCFSEWKATCLNKDFGKHFFTKLCSVYIENCPGWEQGKKGQHFSQSKQCITLALNKNHTFLKQPVAQRKLYWIPLQF